MKRKLQEEQWAKDLKGWENEASSEPWDRPLAGGWDRIESELPKEKPNNRVIVWFKQESWSLIAAAIIGVAMLAVLITNTNHDGDVLSKKTETVLQPKNNSDTAVESQKNESLNAIEEIKTSERNEVLPRFNEGRNISSNLPNQANENKEKSIEEAILLAKEEPVNEQYLEQSIVESASQESSSLLITDVDIEDQKNDIKEDLPLEETTVELTKQNFYTTDHIATLNLSIDNTPIVDIAETSNISVMSKRPSPWSVDVYTQKSLNNQPAFRSPLIELTPEKSQSFGAQLNRKIGNKFSLHVGVQMSTDIVKGSKEFLRFFDQSQETLHGTTRISEFNFSSDLGVGDPIDDNLKIVRDETTAVEDNTRLLFQINRQFSTETISIPLQLSYKIWAQYPFELSGLVGAKYMHTKQSIEHSGISINNNEFSILEVNQGQQNRGYTETSNDVVLQAGMRLDVHLTPKLSLTTQLDYQKQAANSLSPFVNTRASELRLGLSYNL